MTLCYRETNMYQVTKREKGTCFFGCAGEVTKFTKDAQTVQLCRTHLWQALGNGEKAKKPTGETEKKQ